MTTKRTIAYGLLFAALVAAYVMSGRMAIKSQVATFEAKRVFEFEGEDVQSLSIEVRDATVVEAFRGADNEWRIVSPYDHIPPNAPVWDQLAIIAAKITNERDIREGSLDLINFDLDPARLVVRIGTTDGTLTQVSFGAIDPTRVHRYSRIGTDDSVFLTRAEIFHAMKRTLDELRDPRVFPGSADGVDAIEFHRIASPRSDGTETPEIRERYERDAEGIWWITEPVRAQANQDKMRALVEDLPLLAGENHIDDPGNAADYGLASPFATLTAYHNGEELGALSIGWPDERSESDGAFFATAKRSPSVFTVDAHIVTLLPQTALDFRERRLFTGSAMELTRLDYRDANHSLTLATAPESGWRLIEPSVDDSDQFRISTYIAALKILEGEGFPDTADTGLDEPRIELALHYGVDDEPTYIRIGKPVPDSDPLLFYAQTDFGLITTVNLDDFRWLAANPFMFRKRELMPFNTANVEIIKLSMDDTDYAFVRQSGVWHVAEPENHMLESQADINELLQTLAAAPASGIADPQPHRDVTGLDAPLLEARVMVKPGTAPAPLRVGNLKASASRKRFAEVEGRDDLYYVDQALIDDIRASLQGVVENIN